MLNINKIFSSVVMPVHNGENYLLEAIESVLNQTYTNFEFLIIESCSKDSTLAIVKSYNDSRIRLIIEEDCGQVQAYNRGFREAKGDYIFIHDQDDISHSERFKKQLECLLNMNIDICGSFIKNIDEKGSLIYFSPKKINDLEIKKKMIYDPSSIHNSAVCINKNVLLKLGYWRTTYYPIADSEFYIRASLVGFNFGNIPEYLYSYRRHKSQITSKPSTAMRAKLRKLELDYLTARKNEFGSDEYYFMKSMIFYRTDFLLNSFFYNILSILKGKLDRESIKYLVILLIFGLPIKFFRKYSLIDSPLLYRIKNKLTSRLLN